MRLAMTRVLRRAGYAVEEARDGLEALAKLQAGGFPVVVTDVRMPKLDGVAFLGRARELSPQTAIVMITAYGTVASAVEAVRRGASDYILKPFPPEVLERAVGQAFASSGASSGRRAGGASEKSFLTQDPAMERLLERVRRAAESEATILIEAESGAGKEL